MDKTKIRDAAALAAMTVLLAIWAAAITGTAEAAEWSAWQDVKQASYYGGYGSASGIKAKNKMAVPISKVVSKKKWMRGSKKYKRTHFYYGEKVQLRVVKGRYEGKTRTFTVVDCGDFYCAGGHIGKGKHRRYVRRLFDLHENGIRNFLGYGEGVNYVTWRYKR